MSEKRLNIHRDIPVLVLVQKVLLTDFPKLDALLGFRNVNLFGRHYCSVCVLLLAA